MKLFCSLFIFMLLFDVRPPLLNLGLCCVSSYDNTELLTLLSVTDLECQPRSGALDAGEVALPCLVSCYKKEECHG